MDVPSLEPYSDTQTDPYPLLMERMESCGDHEQAIDSTRGNGASSSSSRDTQLPRIEPLQDENRTSAGSQVPSHQTPLSTSNQISSRNSSFIRRGDGYGRRRRSPLNSRLWISVELLVTVSQIIASIIVLSLSRNENPQAPLFAWALGYASGCVATLPILYWRYHNRNQGTEQDSSQSRMGSSQSNSSSESASYTAISVTQSSEEENNHTRGTGSRNNQVSRGLSTRLNGLVDHFKMALDCFFAVWFVVGNVWIFGGHTSPSDAPKLYRLCIVFLTFSCIGYAMPFILCATICCCLPCIISILGFRDEFSQTKGATPEIINTLPTYKFKLKKNGNGHEESNSGASEGGLLAAGTEKERAISGEDAVCCICLAKYADNDELRELPCFHFFHVDCVDKWLKINALCPLCKNEVGDRAAASPSARNSSQQLNGSAEGTIYGSTVF